jgi:hypothetical protein
VPGVAFFARAKLGLGGAEGVGDALVGCVGLPVNAVGVGLRHPALAQRTDQLVGPGELPQDQDQTSGPPRNNTAGSLSNARASATR